MYVIMRENKVLHVEPYGRDGESFLKQVQSQVKHYRPTVMVLHAQVLGTARILSEVL